MGFVVKLTSRDEHVFWLSRATEDGARTLTARENADKFQTFEDANLAIQTLSAVFKSVGFIFSVESDD
jgi:hypothetical protein